MKQNLTNTFVKQLQPQSSRYWITDLRCPGLTLAIYPSGTKTYYYRYKHKGSRKNNSVKIGSAQALSINAAREATAVIIGELAKGIDPKAKQKQKLKEEEKAKSASTLELFVYIDAYYAPYAKMTSVCADEIVSALKREFEFIKNKPINKIDGLDIDLWRSKRKTDITFARIKRIYTYLKACINTALKHYKLIDRFELQNYTLKRRIDERVNPPKVRYLSNNEEAQLLKALDNRDQELREKRLRYVDWQSKRNHSKKKLRPFSDNDYPDHITPIIIIAYHTGFDIGDIFDIHWEHVDFPNNQIRKVRNKTKHKAENPQPVVVPMSIKVKNILEQWGKQHGTTGRIFNSPITDGRLNNITKAWISVSKNACLEDFRLKDLRHTFGSWLAINGVDILQIRDLMGHTNVKTTQIYAHLCPKQKQQAVMAVFS